MHQKWPLENLDGCDKPCLMLATGEAVSCESCSPLMALEANVEQMSERAPVRRG